MGTKVVHCKLKPFDIYIGRHCDPVKGRWGNKYSHKEGTLAEFKTETIEEAMTLYEIWLLKESGLIPDLGTLKDKTLGCWCKIKGHEPCHGDILAKYADLAPDPSNGSKSL